MTVLYPVHGQSHGQFALQQFQQAEHQFERQLKESFAGDSLQNGTETINSIERMFLGIGERAAHVIPDPQPTVRLTVRISFSGRRPLSLLPNNQAEYRGHPGVFALDEGQGNAKYRSVTHGTSACSPDVLPQLTHCIDVVSTVRDSVRVLENAEHAN